MLLITVHTYFELFLCVYCLLLLLYSNNCVHTHVCVHVYNLFPFFLFFETPYHHLFVSPRNYEQIEERKKISENNSASNGKHPFFFTQVHMCSVVCTQVHTGIIYWKKWFCQLSGMQFIYLVSQASSIHDAWASYM